jgi:putative membrane protein
VRSILVKIIINGLAIWVATRIIPEVRIEGDTASRTALSLVVVGALFGIINTVIKPVVKLLSLPFYVLTLGLFALVVNALMLKIVSYLSTSLGIAFDAGPFFWSTIGAAIVVTLVSMVLNLVIPDGD